ncbi:MAG: putative DUF214 family protein, partial [Streblomastix strix]
DEEDAQVAIIDSAREKELQIGRKWEYSEDVPMGAVIVTKQLATFMGVDVGGKIKFKMNFNNFSAITADIIRTQGFDNSEASKEVLSGILNMLEDLEVEAEVIDIANNDMGKGASKRAIFFEYSTFWEFIVDNVIPEDTRSILPRSQWLMLDEMAKRDKFKSLLYDYASTTVFSYPGKRTEIYITFNTNGIKKKLLKWATPISYALRFDQLRVNTGLVNMFDAMQQLSMLFQMIAILIIVLLCLISLLLIYSLLMISVDTRTFELGILRMVGLNRIGIFGVLITQALLYSIPGIIIGIVLGIIINSGIIAAISHQSSVPLSRMMPALSIIISISVSLGISIIASVFPIRQALSQNLHDSVDVSHTKQTSVKISIERSEALKRPWSILISGVILTGIGAGVYLLLPASLVTGKMQLLAIVLFALLLMILIGFVMITVNFEFVFERLVAFVFFIWESKAVKFLAVKNLTAHRERNRKTTLLFSISLSFIVFINVMASIAMSLIVDMSYHSNAGDFHCYIDSASGSSITAGQPTAYQPLAKHITTPGELQNEVEDKFGDIVELIAWSTLSLESVYPSPIRTQIGNIGRSHTYNHQLIGATSNFMDNIRKQNLNVGSTAEKRVLGKYGNGDSPIKQLYTHRVRQLSAVLSNGLKNDVSLKANEKLLLSVIPVTTSTSSGLGGAFTLFGGTSQQSLTTQDANNLHRLTIYPSAFMKAQPFFTNPPETMSLSSSAQAPLSIPTFLSLLPDGEGDYEQLKWNDMFIRLKKKGKEGWPKSKVNSEGKLNIILNDSNNNNSIEININKNIDINVNLTQNQDRQPSLKYSKSVRKQRIDELTDFLEKYKMKIVQETDEEEDKGTGDEEDVSPEEIELTVWSLEEETGGIASASTMINIAFIVITAFVMLLCLFSLMASMHTNVLEQTKEIGIERALGLKRFQLVRVYIEEAFILVISATVMGMIVGIVIGYLLTSQMGMMQGLSVPFVFPWVMALAAVGSAIIISILASAGPALTVVFSNIVTTMKST